VEGLSHAIHTYSHSWIHRLRRRLAADRVAVVVWFADNGAAMWTPIVLGIAMIGAAMCTDYELGVVHQIPMPVHLGMDAVMGICLAVSPWVFQFDRLVWMPHVILGVVEILAALTTETRPGSRSAGLAMR